MESHDEKNISLPFWGIPQIWPFLRPYRKILFVNFALGILSSLADSIYPLFNSYALNHFIAENTLEGFGWFVLAYGVILVLQVIDNFVSTYQCGRIEMMVDRDLRNAAFHHLQTLSFSYFNQHNVGYIHARVISDAGKIGELVAWRMMDLIWHGSYILCVFCFMLMINVRLTLYLLALLPAAVFLIVFFQRRLVRLNWRIREINSAITGNFNEGIAGARTIKTMAIEPRMQKDFEADTEKMKNLSVKTTHNSALFNSLITFMSAMALALVLWKGGKITMDGVILLGTLSVFVSYALNMMEPIQNLVQTLAAFIAIQVNIERLMRLLHTQSDVADRPEVTDKYGDTFRPKKENWEPLLGDVEFRDVSFRYPDGDEMVLEHFNLKVPRGTNVAIVGETGAGKSTLVNLVCRFFEPTEGEVLIDGRDARDRSQLWLHSSIGYVLQAPHLFSGTVRENLRYGKPDASDEEIWEALRLVSADYVVQKMENGLDAEVGEGGDLLSTGEKQLLCFARALLADPRILVLDEATASIDTLTEKLIQDAIQTVIRGRTSFVIAHRLSTVVDADVILVVRDGKIVEQGTHRELMQDRGYYFELYTRQYEDMAISIQTTHHRT